MRSSGHEDPDRRSRAELEALGYDERLRRLWRMYLAYCEAGFAERRIALVQAVLAKPQWRRDELGLAATAQRSLQSA